MGGRTRIFSAVGIAKRGPSAHFRCLVDQVVTGCECSTCTRHFGVRFPFSNTCLRHRSDARSHLHFVWLVLELFSHRQLPLTTPYYAHHSCHGTNHLQRTTALQSSPIQSAQDVRRSRHVQCAQHVHPAGCRLPTSSRGSRLPNVRSERRTSHQAGRAKAFKRPRRPQILHLPRRQEACP